MNKKQVRNISKIIAIIVVIILIGILIMQIIKKSTYKTQNPVATMEVEGFGTVKMELYPDIAPETVANFIALANNGFYNGLTFHRTIPDFMIQGGDKKGDGTGSPTLSAINKNIEEGSTEDKEYCIKGEFKANGVENNLKHEAGVVSMARSDYSSLASTDASLLKKGYNSAGSQFFIMTEKKTNLDGNYAAFGKVIEGMDVVEKIENVDVVTRDENATEGLNKPVNPPVITSISVETYGVDYGLPETEEPFDYTTWMMQNYGANTTGTTSSSNE